MEPSFWIALYGAVMSTVALGWNILNSISQFKGKLRVDKQRSLTFSPEGIELTPMISCRVTNVGKSSRHIDMPMLDFVSYRAVDRSKLDALALLQMKPADKYPMELKPGEIHEVQYNLYQYYDQVLKMLPLETKLCLYVLDTHGKKYTSSQFTAGDLIADVLGAKSWIRDRLAKSSTSPDQ